MSVVLRQTTHQNQASCGFWFENGQKNKSNLVQKELYWVYGQDPRPTHPRPRRPDGGGTCKGGGGKSNLSEQGDASEHIYSTHGEDMASAKKIGSFSTKNTI